MLLVAVAVLLSILLLAVLLVWVMVLLVLGWRWVRGVAAVGVIALVVLALGSAVPMLLGLAVLVLETCWQLA